MNRWIIRDGASFEPRHTPKNEWTSDPDRNLDRLKTDERKQHKAVGT